MKAHDPHDIKRAMEFLAALNDVCDSYGLVLDSHSEMHIKAEDGTLDMGTLFTVRHGEVGYVIEEPIR